MNIADIIGPLSLDAKSARGNEQNAVSGVYVSDLLSDVMGNSTDGNVWITLQTHMNIVAVAGLKNLSAIIIVGNRDPQPDVLQKAEEEKVMILTTPFTAFEAAGKLYQLLNP